MVAVSLKKKKKKKKKKKNIIFFFFKQKTAYEMCDSDWSSDVCSSDLVAKPRLVLADEPTGNLDGETARAVADMLFALPREQGATLLLITHDPKLAARCDREVRMADGRFVTDSAAERAA